MGAVFVACKGPQDAVSAFGGNGVGFAPAGVELCSTPFWVDTKCTPSSESSRGCVQVPTGIFGMAWSLRSLHRHKKHRPISRTMLCCQFSICTVTSFTGEVYLPPSVS